MALRITCPGCQKRFKGPDNLAGRQIKCPACNTVFQVPSLEASPPRAAAASVPTSPAQPSSVPGSVPDPAAAHDALLADLLNEELSAPTTDAPPPPKALGIPKRRLAPEPEPTRTEAKPSWWRRWRRARAARSRYTISLGAKFVRLLVALIAISLIVDTLARMLTLPQIPNRARGWVVVVVTIRDLFMYWVLTRTWDAAPEMGLLRTARNWLLASVAIIVGGCFFIVFVAFMIGLTRVSMAPSQPSESAPGPTYYQSPPVVDGAELERQRQELDRQREIERQLRADELAKQTEQLRLETERLQEQIRLDREEMQRRLAQNNGPDAGPTPTDAGTPVDAASTENPPVDAQLAAQIAAAVAPFEPFFTPYDDNLAVTSKQTVQDDYFDCILGEAQVLDDKLYWYAAAKEATVGLRWGVGVSWENVAAPPPFTNLQELLQHTDAVGLQIAAGLVERLRRGDYGQFVDDDDSPVNKIVILGAADDGELILRARRQALDAVLVFQMSRRQVNPTQMEVAMQVRVVDVPVRQRYWISPELSSRDAQRYPKEVPKFIETVLTGIDQRYRLSPYAQRPAADVKSRAEGFSSAKVKNVLAGVAEIRYFQLHNLVPSYRAAAMYNELLSLEVSQGTLLAGDDAVQKREILDGWLQKQR